MNGDKDIRNGDRDMMNGYDRDDGHDGDNGHIDNQNGPRDNTNSPIHNDDPHNTTTNSNEGLDLFIERLLVSPHMTPPHQYTTLSLRPCKTKFHNNATCIKENARYSRHDVEIFTPVRLRIPAKPCP